MSKKSRTFQPPTTSGGAPAPAGATAPTPPRATSVAGHAGHAGHAAPAPVTPTSSAATSRAAARRRASSAGRVSAPPSFFERYRVLIIGGVGILVVVAGILAVVAGMSSTGANAYECTTLLTPGPTDPVPTPRPATPAPSVDPGCELPAARPRHPSRNRPSDSASRPRTWARAT